MPRDRKWVIVWLATGALMVASMVIIGGITRLTHSGLSMTDWKLIMGMVPPMNEVEWHTTFEQYKQFPEYQKVNRDFTLSDFKAIFFWEYLHRMIGRLIGIVFIVPFVVFLIRRNFDRKMLIRLLVLLGLGALQGFLGWFMVRSGLVDRPSVSHYRLAIHLSAAFITFCYILRLILLIVHPNRGSGHGAGLRPLSLALTGAISVQIILGAFVAGLKAGFIFPTFPTMGGQMIPDAMLSEVGRYGIVALVSEVASVQFMHRTFGYVVVLLVAAVWVKGRNLNLNVFQKNCISLLLLAVAVQFILGVLTLVYVVPVPLAVLHQFGALALLSVSVALVYGLPAE